jgi:hypothetical protein
VTLDGSAGLSRTADGRAVLDVGEGTHAILVE